MAKNICIIGGGTAGWLTAGYLAKRLASDLPGGVTITLLESPDIGVLGVGEGTFPTIRRTLSTIGISESELLRTCGGSFKQGAKFIHWRHSPGHPGRDHYVHPFQSPERQDGLDLLPYWLLSDRGKGDWDQVSSPQKRAADAHRAPKLPTHPEYAAPLSYAFHFDAIALARLLREKSIANGVRHISDRMTGVALSDTGSIAHIDTEAHGTLSADLYIDCTGFRAELIGKALGQPYHSCRDTLFCDRAIALQRPHGEGEPIASYTLATAQSAGWIWDIALDKRRGLGHVYSSDHMSDEEAEQALRAYAGPAARNLDTRLLRFDPGFREVSWHKNCVAIGLSSGFFEPLEATGIVFIEAAAALVANLFPWGDDFDVSARQFNRIMLGRYRRALDFLKLHYCLSQRRDSDFWRDNVASTSIPDSLADRLERWRFRPPSEVDIDPVLDIFKEPSWHYVLYGMGYRTDLSARAGAYRFHAEAKAAFAEIAAQGEFAARNLPDNRALIDFARSHDFPKGPAA